MAAITNRVGQGLGRSSMRKNRVARVTAKAARRAAIPTMRIARTTPRPTRRRTRKRRRTRRRRVTPTPSPTPATKPSPRHSHAVPTTRPTSPCTSATWPRSMSSRPSRSSPRRAEKLEALEIALWEAVPSPMRRRSITCWRRRADRAAVGRGLKALRAGTGTGKDAKLDTKAWTKPARARCQGCGPTTPTTCSSTCWRSARSTGGLPLGIGARGGTVGTLGGDKCAQGLAAPQSGRRESCCRGGAQRLRESESAARGQHRAAVQPWPEWHSRI